MKPENSQQTVISEPEELLRLWVAGELNYWNNPPITGEALALWQQINGQEIPKEEITYE